MQEIDIYNGLGIIPAYAGSTRSGCGTTFSGRDHPRIRGEHVNLLIVSDFPPGSSPHTRGARSRVHRHRRPERIIPAYAGSTTYDKTGSYLEPDHPRIRGEHRMLGDDATLAGGSSPHTRGARALDRVLGCS